MHWMREGFGSATATSLATLFYGTPLVWALLAAGPASRPAEVLEDDDPPSEERVVTFLSLPVPVVEEGEEPPVDLEPAPVPAPAPRVEPPPEGVPEAVPSEAVAPKGRAVAGVRGGRVGAKPSARAPGGGSSRARKIRDCNEPHPNIRTGADGVLEIDRSLVEQYTKNLESFMSLGYSRPYDENGVKGWYISGFSCTSPVQKAGFRRGDVLLRVNGKPTRSWVGVFLLYQRLKNKDVFEVELLRKGKPVRLQFRVVG